MAGWATKIDKTLTSFEETTGKIQDARPNADTVMSLYLKLKEAHPNIARVIDDLVKEKNGDPRNPKKTFVFFDDYPLWKIGKEMKKAGLKIADPSYLKGTQWNYSGPAYK